MVMNEFSQRWAALGKWERRKVRRNMRAKALEFFSVGLRLRLTASQLKSAARTTTDMAIAKARTA